MYRKPDKSVHPSRISGFTLIELLTVIAIIAILAAIIFPIFASVRENGYQSTSISNMHDISVKLAQYELDNHRYPEVLFGYVYCTDKNVARNSHVYIPGDTDIVPIAMDKALALAETNYAAATTPADKAAQDPARWFPGLYPEYIKDPHEFMDPNNLADDLTLVADPDVNVLCPSTDDACLSPPRFAGTTSLWKALHTSTTGGVTTLLPHGFYVLDAYDISPSVTGPNTINTEDYIPRYQYAWTDINDQLNCATSPQPALAVAENFCGPAGAPTNKYLNQVHWKAPPARAYVTCTTYHVPQAGQVLMLNETGNVRKVGYQEFVGGPGGSDATGPLATPPGPGIVPDANGVSNAKFWKIEP